jgi:hypothetical protein
MHSHYLLKIDGKTSGPHSLAALTEMASIRAFDDATLIALDNTEDWKPVKENPELLVMFFPPRKTILLKEKTFETIGNDATTEPVSVHAILSGNLAAETKNSPLFRPGVRYRNRRRRDFLTSVILCDLVGGAVAYYVPLTHDTKILLLTFFAIINFGLYWLFYQIMDRY